MPAPSSVRLFPILEEYKTDKDTIRHIDAWKKEERNTLFQVKVLHERAQI